MTTEALLALPPELCRHWDRIQYPEGPVSIGKCERCGREREYGTAYGYRNPPPRFPKMVLQRAEDWDG